MKKNFISFPESLEASKRSICCHDFIIFCKVCIDFFFSPPRWHGNMTLQQCVGMNLSKKHTNCFYQYIRFNVNKYPQY